jgi:hypothetical protein
MLNSFEIVMKIYGYFLEWILFFKVVRGNCKGGFFAQFSTEAEIGIAYNSLLTAPFGKKWLDIKPCIGGISSLDQVTNQVKPSLSFFFTQSLIRFHKNVNYQWVKEFW